MSAKEHQTVRCAITDEVLPCDSMLRCVWVPEMQKVVLDLGQKLKGEDVWLLPSEEVIEHALSQKLFDTVFTPGLDVTMITPKRVVALLKKRCLEFLSLANKGGALVYGAERVQVLLSQSAAYVLLVASDGSERETQKMQLSAGEIAIVPVFSGQELGKLFGKERVVYVAVKERHFAKSFQKVIKRLIMIERSVMNNKG